MKGFCFESVGVLLLFDLIVDFVLALSILTGYHDWLGQAGVTKTIFGTFSLLTFCKTCDIIEKGGKAYMNASVQFCVIAFVPML